MLSYGFAFMFERIRGPHLPIPPTVFFHVCVNVLPSYPMLRRRRCCSTLGFVTLALNAVDQARQCTGAKASLQRHTRPELLHSQIPTPRWNHVLYYREEGNAIVR